MYRPSAGLELQVFQTEVYGVAGGSAVFPVSYKLSPNQKIYLIRWKKGCSGTSPATVVKLLNEEVTFDSKLGNRSQFFAGNGSLIISELRLEDSDVYCIEVNTEQGKDVIKNVNLIVNIPVSDLTISVSPTVQLKCSAGEGSNVSFSWTKTDTPIYPGESYQISTDGRVLTLMAPSPLDKGMYYCVAQNLVNSMKKSYQLGGSDLVPKDTRGSYSLVHVIVGVLGGVLLGLFVAVPGVIFISRKTATESMKEKKDQEDQNGTYVQMGELRNLAQKELNPYEL
nr:PREDICTED: hepatocyte cell adhesion molecule-like [Latimeria chalumnae]|eukprot:XP_014345800.1 PREDICTED: hepatocyte cell adhesion molecule-like [Latimeria chalumnae]